MASQPRILLVNDKAEARALLRRVLERGGFTNLLEAQDGREAVRLLAEYLFDVIVTDVHMPHLDGWRLARMARSGVFRSPPDVPVIVVSATYGERIAEATAREHGVNRFFALKGVKDLDEAVRACLAEQGKEPAKPTLLVVEDRPDTARLVERILQKRFEVEAAKDGAGGLAAWRARHHDLVLLDVMLPGMSGYQVLREILKERPEQAVVIMTAYGTMERSEELMLEGAVDFIAKPFEAEQLRRVCEIAVRREDYLESNRQYAAQVKSLKESEEAQRRVAEAHQRLLDSLGTVVFELDADGRFLFLNRAWRRLTGYPVEDSRGTPLHDHLVPEGRVHYRQTLERLVRESGRAELELRLLTRSGELLWVELSMDGMELISGEAGVSGRLVDVTDRHHAQEKLEYLALHDLLTGLYNRNHFDATLDHLAAGAARGHGPHSLLYIDIDHFKVINDAVGHHSGDLAVKGMAAMLGTRVRDSDILCRLGADEFALLLPDTAVGQAVRVGNDLRETLAAYRYSTSGRDFDFTASIGIAAIDGRHGNAEEYLIEADKALFVAKSRGRNLVHIYSPDDREADELSSSIDWARQLRQAIAEDRLELFFQPILALQGPQPPHHEALIRLHLADGGIATPNLFIPALERAGEIATLDHWVISRAVRVLAEQPRLGRLAVNLSAHAFRDEQILPLVERELTALRVDPTRIIFEITETASLINPAATARMIEGLRALGCGFALDDFGTGFSTFSYVKQLPADYLKIDGSFVRHIVADPVDRALVHSINELAHLLGKRTIAEFVEDEATLQLLRELGVDYAQGYHIGRPAPLDRSAG